MSEHAPPEKPTIVIVGFSHLGALIRAQELRQAGGMDRFHVEWMIMYPSDRYVPWVSNEAGQMIYHPAFAEDVAALERTRKPSAIFLSVWGDQHFFLSCANSERPFDFVLPWAAGLGRIENTELVPFDLMRSLIREAFALPAGLVSLVTQQVSCPVYSLSAPPAVGPVAEIPAGTSSAGLDELVRRYGVAPPMLRYKFWRLCEVIAREIAEAQDARFLPAPAESFDPEGYRKRDHWGSDWLHGNIIYGEAVLRQIGRALHGEPA